MTTTQTNTWDDVARAAAENAVRSLGVMIGGKLDITSLALGRVSVEDISDRLGGADAWLTGVYLSISGGARGHVTLFFQPEVASELLETLVERPHKPGDAFDEVQRSALGELGNLVGSAFLNTIVDATGLDLRPSPPGVIADMAGSVVDIVAADVLADDADAYVLEVRFRSQNPAFEASLFIVPGADLLGAATERLEASC